MQYLYLVKSEEELKKLSEYSKSIIPQFNEYLAFLKKLPRIRPSALNNSYRLQHCNKSRKRASPARLHKRLPHGNGARQKDVESALFKTA